MVDWLLEEGLEGGGRQREETDANLALQPGIDTRRMQIDSDSGTLFQ